MQFETPVQELQGAVGEEIRVFAVRRSGHHALIHWIAQQNGEPVRFLNDCEPFADPLRMPGRQPRAAEDWYIGIKDPRFFEFADRTLVYNYENLDLRRLAGRSVVPPGVAFGNGGDVREVLILRDPYNLLTSHSRWRPREFEREDYVPGLLELWKVYAREFLRVTRYLADPVCMSYNRWFVDADYRAGLIRALELPVGIDLGVPSHVSQYGRGSSFDGFAMDGRAERMKVLERWREFDGPRPLTELVDPETRELSDQIFGPIIG